LSRYGSLFFVIFRHSTAGVGNMTPHARFSGLFTANLLAGFTEEGFLIPQSEKFGIEALHGTRLS
jgi:hypothetical protein